MLPRHLCSIHAMPDDSLVLLLRRQVADPAAHQVQDHCTVWDALPVQLSHLQPPSEIIIQTPGDLLAENACSAHQGIHICTIPRDTTSALMPHPSIEAVNHAGLRIMRDAPRILHHSKMGEKCQGWH